MTKMLIDAKQRTAGLPSDLRHQVGERVLIALALEAVQTLEDQLPRPPELAGGCSPQMLLTLLTYCYAAGFYGSEDIEWACSNDAAAHYLCGNTAPDEEALRNFRRANRPWIEACLTSLYEKALGASIPTVRGPVPIPGFQKRSRAELGHVVRRKLDLAIMIDMAMCE